MKEMIMLAMGLNCLGMKDYKAARKTFEKCLKDVPNGAGCDKALLGLMTAQLGLGSITEAEATLARLQSQFPGSPSTQLAIQNLETVKSSRR
jgi:TolA-binding protein